MKLTEKRHIMGYRQLAGILALLLLLTVATVAVSYRHLGFWNVPVALTIASSKATLVLLFFMHLKFEGPVIRYSFISAVFFLAIMIGFTFWDVAFR